MITYDILADGGLIGEDLHVAGGKDAHHPVPLTLVPVVVDLHRKHFDWNKDQAGYISNVVLVINQID